MAYRNEFATVVDVDAKFPDLKRADPGRFVDQVAHRLNKRDGEIRWGRKARNADGTNLNLDALAYLNVPTDRSRKTLVDIIIAKGTMNAKPSWQEFLGDNVGNGFWAPPAQPDLEDGAPPPVPSPIPKTLKIALRTANGQYVCAEGGGGSIVVANRTAIGPWETFEVVILE